MKQLERTYIIALSLIALTTISSQLVVQYCLQRQKLDAHVVNIAGKQRMLSQKITKHTLLISTTKNDNDFQTQQQLLSEALYLWRNTHQGLQEGNQDLQLPKLNENQDIKDLFEEIAPHFSAINNSASKIIIAQFEDLPLSDEVNIIIQNEESFLKLMDQIVYQFESEANLKLNLLKVLETVFMTLTLVILLLEALFIFKPIIKRTRVYLKNIQNKHQQLISIEEELRQNLEESNSIRDLLEENEIKLLQALSENEAVTKSLNESVIVVITDLTGHIIGANEKFCSISGYSESELIGENMNILDSGFHSIAFWKEVWETIERGDVWRGEVKNRKKDGSFFWVDMVNNSIEDEKGEINKYFCVGYDITAKKDAEEEVQKMAMVASEASDGIIVTDKNGFTEWVNAGFIRHTGYTLEEIRGKKPGHILQGQETNPMHIQKIRDGLDRNIPFTQEILNYKKQGEKVWLDLHITPIFDSSGNLLQHIAIERDITKLKKAEDIIKEKNDKAQKNIKYLLQITKNQEILTGSWQEISRLVTQAIVNGLGMKTAEIWYHNFKLNKLFCIGSCGKYLPASEEILSINFEDKPLFFSSIQEEKQWIVKDIENDTFLDANSKEEFLKNGYKSIILYPIILSEKQKVLLVIGHDKPYHWSDEDLIFINTMDNAISLTYQYYRRNKSRKEIEELNKSLEKKVEDRTASLEKKTRKLHEIANYNAHIIRSPIVEILGLYNVLEASDTPEEDLKEIFPLLIEAVKSLDRISRHTQRIVEAEADEDFYQLVKFNILQDEYPT